jgi:hypothetical protein
MRLPKVTGLAAGRSQLVRVKRSSKDHLTHPVMGGCPVPFRAAASWEAASHRIPTTPGSTAPAPQKTHGQNDTIGHSAARLLLWSHSPCKLFVQVKGLAAIVYTRFPQF